MLTEFLYRQELDIVCLQEVVNSDVVQIGGYNAYINLGRERRGTAILTREGMHVGQEKSTPSGRGIAIEINKLWYINIYAPSGAEKKSEREAFYNTELLMLIPASPVDLLLAGDFNCILHPADSTASVPTSPMLGRMVTGLGL